jgi:hypothetical protein
VLERAIHNGTVTGPAEIPGTEEVATEIAEAEPEGWGFDVVAGVLTGGSLAAGSK